MTLISRRNLMKSAAAGTGLVLGGAPLALMAEGIDELVIANNVNLPSWDPTVGLSAVNPTIQGIYQSVFDMYIHQNPDLSPAPGLLTDWGFNEDKTGIWVDCREGVKWHNGDDFGPEDVVYTWQRTGNPENGSPLAQVWGNLQDIKVDGNRITAKMGQFDPMMLKWMYFLTGYCLPKNYMEAVGPEGFEAAPIGTGPYMVDKYERNAFVRLKANPDYWGGEPAFKTVTIKFVTDAASRVAEIESGNAHVAVEMPYEEYDRLKGKNGISGTDLPVSDVGMIFINDIGVMLDENVRKAAAHAIDKATIVERLLSGYGVPIDTLLTPDYDAYDASITVPYDPDLAKELLAKSGYSTDNPAKLKIQTTRGFKPKDYEVIQAIVGLWRRVGIEAEIEVYEVAKHFELRAADQLAEMAFYNWGNSVGDPASSVAFAMFGPSPHSVWDGEDMIQQIGPLWVEADEEKRMAAYRDVNAYIAEHALVIPLMQYVQPILHSDKIKVVQHASGSVLPALWSPS